MKSFSSFFLVSFSALTAAAAVACGPEPANPVAKCENGKTQSSCELDVPKYAAVTLELERKEISDRVWSKLSAQSCWRQPDATLEVYRFEGDWQFRYRDEKGPTKGAVELISAGRSGDLDSIVAKIDGDTYRILLRGEVAWFTADGDTRSEGFSASRACW